MSNSGLQMVVDSWVIDVQRRGAELYAMNRANEVLYLSFEGEDQLHYSIEIDFDVNEVVVQMNCPDWDSFKRETFLLNAENLRLLAKKMCPLPEREAIVPVYLLERLSILCHAHERLLQEYERKPHFQTSTNTVLQISSELRKYLTPEEQRRIDDPLLHRGRTLTAAW
jgi:hypothetical protein